MLFYLSIFVFVSFLGYIELNGVKRSYSVATCYLVGFFFFVLSFIRWENGSDWNMYIKYYENITFHSNFNYYMEPIYSTLLVVSKFYFSHYTYALLLLGAIIFYFQTKAIKQSVFPIISMLVLVGMSFANIFFVRQTFAQVILMFSIYYIINKKIWRFILCVIFAAGFHISSLIFLPAYWLFYLNINKKGILILTILSMFVSPIAKAIVANVSFFNEVTLYKLELYSSGKEDVTNLGMGLFYAKAIANRILFYAIGLYLYDRVEKDCNLKYAKHFFVFFAIGTMLYFALEPISNVFSRLSRYYEVGQVFLIPIFVKYLKDNKKDAGIFYLIVSLILMLKLYLFLSTYDCYIPFKVSPLFENACIL